MNIRKSISALVAGLLFYGAALVCIRLAIPPGYASPAWAPAGIAIGAMLVAGPWCLVGTTIAHAAINLHVGADAPTAILIALGGLAQAAAVRNILCKECRDSHVAFGSNACIRNMLVAALAGSAISAIIGVLTISASDHTTTAARGLGIITHVRSLEFIAWTAGDFIGISIFAPLVVFATHRRRMIVALWPTFAIFCAAAIAFGSWPGVPQWWAMTGSMLVAAATSWLTLIGCAQSHRADESLSRWNE